MAALAPAAAAPPLVLDAHADTLDHVVRAVARSGFLPQAVRLMLASREHLHDPELLYRTRGVRGWWGGTLLMCALRRRDVARAGEILRSCPTSASRVELLACVNAHGWAALHIACAPYQPDEEEALPIVELLLANGADPLAPNRLSLDNDDDDDDHGETAQHPIHLAAQWSDRLVQRLVQAGASIDGDVDGDSTLCCAASAGTAQGVRMIPRLVALGARETRGNEALRLFTTHPVESAQPTSAAAVAALNALVSVGCSLIQPDDEGVPPLYGAADAGNAPVVRALLSMGVPATTGSLVHGVKHSGIIRTLLAAGALPNALVPVRGLVELVTPLMVAAFESELESVQLLLAASPGVGVRQRDSAGRTALIWVPYSPSVLTLVVTRVAEALVEAGADVGARDHDGNTALHNIARNRAKPWAVALAQLLRASGASARAVNHDGKTPAQLLPAYYQESELYLALA